MARLIQAVVNRATNETNDVHVEFNSPNIMSINLPVHVMTAAVRPPSTAAAAAPPPASAAAEEASADNSPPPAGNGEAAAASTSSGARSGEQRANTLPTTSTQTRSTSRPQIQIGGNNNWGSRIAPTHTAFDRFLPCNSHHIREPEPQNNNNASGSSSNNNRSTTTAAPTVGTAIVLPTSSAGVRPGEFSLEGLEAPYHVHFHRHDPLAHPFIRTRTRTRNRDGKSQSIESESNLSHNMAQ